ncbi:MAG: flippase [Ignavibacteriales bacterium]|nr:flippase [Ignavibacteriales bacterium]
MSKSVAESVANNAVIMMGSQVITWISSIVLMLFLPRYLGSEDYGRLYLAISLTMIFQIIIDFGGHYFIAKEVSRNRESAPQLLANSSALRMFMWFMSIVVIVALCLVAGYSGLVTSLILILGMAKLWEGVGKVMNSCFQGFEMMRFPVLGSIAERVFVTAAGVVALMLGQGSVTIALIMALSTFLNALVVSHFLPRIVSKVPHVDMNEVKNLLKLGAPYFLFSMFAVLYFRVDTVMLSLMVPEAVVGWFGAAHRLFDSMMFLPSISSLVLLPVFSKLWNKQKNELVSTTQKSLEFILLAGIPISIGLFVFAENIVYLFFGGNEYAPSTRILQIFAVGLPLVYVDMILGTFLFASDKQRQWTITALVAVFLNPALNMFFIPYTQSRFGNGGIGASVATIMVEFFVMCCALSLMPREVLDRRAVSRSIKAILAGAVMATALWIMNIIGLHWIEQAAIASVTYCSFLLLLKVFHENELLFLKQLFSISGLKNVILPSEGVS